MINPEYVPDYYEHRVKRMKAMKRKSPKNDKIYPTSYYESWGFIESRPFWPQGTLEWVAVGVCLVVIAGSLDFVITALSLGI